MACQVLLEVKIVDGFADPLKAKFAELLPDTRSFDGCIYIYLTQDLDDPSKLIIIELWESRAHYDRYLQWRTDRGDMEALGAMMEDPSWTVPRELGRLNRSARSNLGTHSRRFPASSVRPCRLASRAVITPKRI